MAPANRNVFRLPKMSLKKHSIEQQPETEMFLREHYSLISSFIEKRKRENKKEIEKQDKNFKF